MSQVVAEIMVLKQLSINYINDVCFSTIHKLEAICAVMFFNSILFERH